LFSVAAMMPTSSIRPSPRASSLIFCFTAGGKETSHPVLFGTGLCADRR
jgi:hypothetical protein